jgi:hypothetical protein
MSRRNILRGSPIALLTVLAGLANVARAQAPTAPGVAGPNYSVIYVAEGAESSWLEERVGGGSWQTVPNSGTSPVAFTNKPSGAYSYRSAGMWFVGYDMYYDQYIYQVFYSPETPVTVLANRDPVSTQKTYQYQTRQGDINGDGRTDLFIRRTSGGSANNGVLENVILQQNSAGGTFSTVVPTGSQYNTALGWPVSSASVVIDDFNVDGFVDVELKGVAAATGASGATDQIVFSPAAATTTPKGLRAVDDGLKTFAANALDYSVDRNFISNQAVLQSFVGYLVVFSCSFGVGGVMDDIVYSFPIPCVLGTIYISGSYWDYRGVHEEAVAIWTNDKAYGTGSATATAATQGMKHAVEDVLGVPVGGWSMEEELGGLGEYSDPDVRRALEVFWSILGIGRANAAQTQEAPPQTRYLGNVYIVGHPVWYILPTHTALEYTSTTIPTTTIGAGPEPLPIIGPFLVSRLNRPTDRAAYNMIHGTVVSLVYPVPELYFLAAEAADARYPDNLGYHAYNPGGPLYNSNGYTHGLIIATQGVPSVDMNKFVGGWHAVPTTSFQ